jgi:hypothetical protein
MLTIKYEFEYRQFHSRDQARFDRARSALHCMAMNTLKNALKGQEHLALPNSTAFICNLDFKASGGFRNCFIATITVRPSPELLETIGNDLIQDAFEGMVELIGLYIHAVLHKKTEDITERDKGDLAVLRKILDLNCAKEYRISTEAECRECSRLLNRSYGGTVIRITNEALASNSLTQSN